MITELFEKVDGTYQSRPFKMLAENVKLNWESKQDPTDNLQNKIQSLYNSRIINWESVVNGYSLPTSIDTEYPFCHWQDVAYGDGVWVAVGTGYHGAHTIVQTSHIVYSTDGKNWTMVEGMDKDYKCVEYNEVESKFLVLTADGAYKVLSSDGINWSQSATSFPSQFTGKGISKLKCYNGLFYLLFDASISQYAYSDNGTSWSVTNTGYVGHFNDIIISNIGDIYIGGTNILLYKGYDTSVWGKSDINCDILANGIINGCPIILLVAKPNAANNFTVLMVFNEEDGTNQVVSNTSLNPHSVIYDEHSQRFIMIEKEKKQSKGANNIIYVSQNGLNWYKMGVSDSAHWSGIATNDNGQYVMVSEYGMFNQFVAPYKAEKIPSGIFAYGRIREYV